MVIAYYTVGDITPKTNANIDHKICSQYFSSDALDWNQQRACLHMSEAQFAAWGMPRHREKLFLQENESIIGT